MEKPMKALTSAQEKSGILLLWKIRQEDAAVENTAALKQKVPMKP